MHLTKRPQPETVLAPVSYRSSRRRRQRKRLLLKVPIMFSQTIIPLKMFLYLQKCILKINEGKELPLSVITFCKWN